MHPIPEGKPSGALLGRRHWLTQRVAGHRPLQLIQLLDRDYGVDIRERARAARAGGLDWGAAAGRSPALDNRNHTGK